MKTLYKYYKSLKKEYFLDPSLKLCCTKNLNDPFENLVDEELTKSILDEIGENTKSNQLDLCLAFKQIDLNEALNKIGIISLTETPRNLLMWAHYADQHRGICIGYKESMLDKHEGKKHEDLPTNFRPIRVKYDNCRYDQFTDVFSNEDKQQLKKDILLKTLLTKSDEWIYEKEYRAIIPMEFHDQIRCIGKRNAHSYVKELSKYKNNLLIARSDNTLEIKHINSPKSLKKSSLDMLSYLTEKQDILIAIKIEPSDITSIYFGCNSDKNLREEIFEETQTNPSLAHINVYMTKPSHTKFELLFIPYEKFEF